jgi:hypothetical protein
VLNQIISQLLLCSLARCRILQKMNGRNVSSSPTHGLRCSFIHHSRNAKTKTDTAWVRSESKKQMDRQVIETWTFRKPRQIADESGHLCKADALPLSHRPHSHVEITELSINLYIFQI